MLPRLNSEFELGGVHHAAFVCRDMASTVAFYRDILGMPLIKTLDLPNDGGQHFFFDCGNGDSIAFFWFPNAPERSPGVASPSALPTQGSFVTAHGSLNHLAIKVPAAKFEAYHQRLIDKGIAVTRVLNHDNSPTQVSPEMNDGVYVRSMYFFDPDGVCLEFAAWTAELNEQDVAHEPRHAIAAV
ncbi:MAG: VOC family protein [Caulobacteraceae bacterium]